MSSSSTNLKEMGKKSLYLVLVPVFRLEGFYVERDSRPTTNEILDLINDDDQIVCDIDLTPESENIWTNLKRKGPSFSMLGGWNIGFLKSKQKFVFSCNGDVPVTVTSDVTHSCNHM